jgi:protein arginine kinase activator
MAIACQQCKQNPATVHLTDIRPSGEAVEQHLCEGCASSAGITMKVHEPTNVMLEKFVKLGASMQQAAKRKCPNCGISFGEFRAQGLLGCPHDYTEFADLLLPLIERTHNGALEHVGKVPGRQQPAGSKRSKLTRLRRMLEDAVAEERYEDAAKLRDDIKNAEAENAA